MRRLKRWAAVLLAVTLAAGNMPVAYAKADGYEIEEQTSDNMEEEVSESDAEDVENEDAENEEAEIQEEEAEQPETEEVMVPEAEPEEKVTGSQVSEQPESEEHPEQDEGPEEQEEVSSEAPSYEEETALPGGGSIAIVVKNSYTCHDNFTITKNWNDSGDTSGRPENREQFLKLYYLMLDHSASEVPTAGYKEFNETNTQEDFGTEWWKLADADADFPAASVADDGAFWTYSYLNNLPDQMTITDENDEQHSYDIYYAVKEADWSGTDKYTTGKLKRDGDSYIIEKEQLNASEDGTDTFTLKTPDQAGGDNITLTNTRCKDPFTVTVNWKDNSNTYLTRPGCHKEGDLYNYQENGHWLCRTLTAEDAADLNQKELDRFKAGLVLKAQTESGEPCSVEGTEMVIEGMDSDTWTIRIDGLPEFDADGNRMIYYLEHHHEDGISANNVPNSQEEIDARIWANPGGEYATVIRNQGVYTGDTSKIYTGSEITNTLEKNIWIMFRAIWEDEGADKSGRPSPTIYLYRTAESGGDRTVDFTRLHPVPGHDSTSVPRNSEDGETNIIEIGYAEGTEGALPLYDAEGQRYVYYAIVHIPDGGDYVQIINNLDGSYKDQVLTAANKEGYLLSMGTLILRRQAKVSLTATKTFVAASMQDIHTVNNVTVTLMLQKCEDGKNWENVTDEDGQLVKRTLTGFRGEQMTVSSDEPYEAPKYNEKGLEIQYRWVETSLTMDNQSVTAPDGEYFKENGIQTPKGADGTTTPVGPGVEGKNSTAHFRVYYKDDGSVVNRLMGNTEVLVTKEWAETGWGTSQNMTLQDWLDSAEGAPYKDEKISFRLKRNDGKSSIPEGDTADDNTLCKYTVSADGTIAQQLPVTDITISVGETLTADDIRNVWNNLPRFDADSHEYIYSVEEIYEGTAPWKTSKTYTKEVAYDEVHDDHYVQKQVHFTNSPLDGELSFQVGKIWLDDGELICRRSVQAALYHKDKDTGHWTRIREISLNNQGNWFAKFSISAVDGDMDYQDYLIVEEKIGDQGKVQLLSDSSGSIDTFTETISGAVLNSVAERVTESGVPTYHDETEENYTAFFGGASGETAEKVQERQQKAVIGKVIDNQGSTGLNHNYNVYLATDQNGAYTIYNQRTGTVNVDVTKTWKTGSDLNEAAVLAITQNGKQIAWLKMLKAEAAEGGYSNTWRSIDGQVLTAGSVGTDIPKDQLASYDTSVLYQKGDYPKYDGLGKLYRYGIEEEAILNRTGTSGDYTVTTVDQTNRKNGKILATVEMKDSDAANAETIYHNYTISSSSSVDYADSPSESDQYSFKVTNAREQMLTLTANKVWQDDGSSDREATEKRQDITFTLYRTTQYDSAEALLKAFDNALGTQADMTNIPRNTIEQAQQALIHNSDVVSVNGESKFLWNTKQNDWYWVSSRFTENERYDENGNPYIYFLIETIPHSGSYKGEYHTRYNNAHLGSTVNGTTITSENANGKLFTPQSLSNVSSTEEVYEPNYFDGGYQSTLSAGVLIVSDGVHSASVKTTYQNGVQSNEIVAPGTEGAVQNYCSYWSHTVMNYRVNTDSIYGKKIWGLPNGATVDESYLPDVTFDLRRESGNGTYGIDADDFRKDTEADSQKALYMTLGQHTSTNAVGKVSFSGANMYQYTVKDLPVYDKYGQRYTYSVTERSLGVTYFKQWNHPADSLLEFVNFYTGDPKAQLSFDKIWKVDGSAPAVLDPVKGTITVTTNEKMTTTSLPTSLTFKIQGYFTKSDGTAGAKISSAAYTVTVKGSYTTDEYNLSGTVRCDGGDQTTEDVPTVEVTKGAVKAGDTEAAWNVTLKNLKSLAPDGSAITYVVTEDVPGGYTCTESGTTKLQTPVDENTPAYSGQTFINAYTGKSTDRKYTSVTVQKAWTDDGYDRTPTEITLKLYRKNASDKDDTVNDVVIEETISLTKDGNWTAVVGKDESGNPTLPVYAPDGQKYAYYLTEIGEDANYNLTKTEYSYENESAVVTATNSLPLGKVYFRKQWQTQIAGQNAKDLTNEKDFERLLNLGALPKVTFTVQYLDTITDPANPSWKDLSRNRGIVRSVYDPKTDPDKYKKDLFTSSYIYFTVPLYVNGTKAAGDNGENYQKYRIMETVEYADTSGTKSFYSEPVTAGASVAAVTTASITNTIPVVQVEIIKKWQDGDNREGIRPSRLSTYLQTKSTSNKWKKMEEIAEDPSLASATTVTDAESQEGNTYTTGVLLLPQNHQELKITEETIDGYTPQADDPVQGTGTLADGTSVATYTFTNTYVPSMLAISAEKQWEDQDNIYGLRNENGAIDLTLWYCVGTDENWQKVMTAPEDQIYQYQVQDKLKVAYKSSSAVYTTTVLNEDASLTARPDSPAVWENLPAYAMDQGILTKVQYKVTESGKNQAYSGTVVRLDNDTFDGMLQFEGTDGETQKLRFTNALKTTSLVITKDWKQEDQIENSESNRPDAVTFQVEYRAGAVGTWKNLPGGTITLKKPFFGTSDTWTKTLTGLPVCDQNGVEYEYRVSEVNLIHEKLLGLLKDTETVSGTFRTAEDGTEVWNGEGGQYRSEVSITKDGDGTFLVSAVNTLEVQKPDDPKEDPVKPDDPKDDPVQPEPPKDDQTNTPEQPDIPKEEPKEEPTKTDSHKKHDKKKNTGSTDTSAEEIITVKPASIDSPMTGDSNDWRVYAVASLGLLAVIFVTIHRIRKKKE